MKALRGVLKILSLRVRVIDSYPKLLTESELLIIRKCLVKVKLKTRQEKYLLSILF